MYVFLPEDDDGLDEPPLLLPSDDDDGDIALDDLMGGDHMTPVQKAGPVKVKKGSTKTKAKPLADDSVVSKKPAGRKTKPKALAKARAIQTFADFANTPAGRDLKMKLLTWPGQSLAKLLPQKTFY
jgi:hypothetical protein